MSNSQGQRKIEEFLTSSITSYNGRSTSPVEVSHSIDDEEQEELHSKPERISLAFDLTRSITSNSKNLIEDSHSYADNEASPEQDEIESQPERQSETQSEATDFSDTTISITFSLSSTSSSSCKTCECYCCSNVSTPHHPLIVNSSKKKQLYFSKQHGKQKAHSKTIQNTWYKTHLWISVCTSHYKVYCATCRAADEQKLLTPSELAKSPFIHHGFNNWKKALDKFREHESSNMHKLATEKLAAKVKGVGIDAQLDAQLRNDQEHHRKY